MSPELAKKKSKEDRKKDVWGEKKTFPSPSGNKNSQDAASERSLGLDFNI
jgi:hypothetical protein